VHLLCDSGGYGGVAWGAITGTLSDQTDLQTALDAKQPLNANLTGISSISTTGSALIVATVSGMSVMTTSDAVLQLLDDTSTSAMRTTLGLGIGTNVQAYDAELTALAGLASAADKVPYFTGSGTAAMATCTAFARTLLDDVNAAAMLTTLGIGGGYQAADATLTAVAGVTTAANTMIYFTGVDTAASTALTTFGRSLIDDVDAAAGRTTLGVVIGTDVQAYDAELDALAGLTSAADRFPYFTGSGTAALGTVTTFARTLLDDTTAAAVFTTLGIGQVDATTADVFKLKNAAVRQCLELMNYETSSTALEGFRIKAVASSNYEIGSFQGSISGANRPISIGSYARATPTVLDSWLEISAGETAVFGGTASVKRFSDATTACNLIFKKHRGTEAAPTALLSGDLLGAMYFQGYTGAALNNSACIIGQAAGAFATGDAPGRLLFQTTPAASTTVTTRMAITEAGLVNIGTWSTATPLSALVTLVANNSTANNTLRFHDLYNAVGGDSVLGKIEFYSGDATAPGVGVIGDYSMCADGAAPIGYHKWTVRISGTLIEAMRLESTGRLIAAMGIQTPYVAQSGEIALGITGGTTAATFLTNGNHQTLPLATATGTVAFSIDVSGAGASSGSILITQHATTPRGLTWTVSSGTIKWVTTQPTWSSDAVNTTRNVRWRWNGSVLFLEASAAI
jgi:hypothetical protein